MTKKIVFHDMGRTFYRSSLLFQEEIVSRKVKSQSYPDFLLFTEHEPVITLGKRGGGEFIDKSSPYFKKNNPEIVNTKRGGLVTCHMPGQVVLYPILNLRNHGLGVRDYSYLLMDVITDFLGKFDIESFQSKEYPGVWVNNRKIGNIGLGIKKNITYHGLSINVDNRGDLFDIVTPCGISNAEVTRVADETSKVVSIPDAKKELVDSFFKIFNVIEDQSDIAIKDIVQLAF